MPHRKTALLQMRFFSAAILLERAPERCPQVSFSKAWNMPSEKQLPVQPIKPLAALLTLAFAASWVASW